MTGGRGRAPTEPGHVFHARVQAQTHVPHRAPVDTAAVDGGVGADLCDEIGLDEGGVQEVAGAPCRRELRAGPGVAGAGAGQVLGKLTGSIGAQRDRAADGAEAAGGVVAAEDEGLGGG